jgi:hypothetical protein
MKICAACGNENPDDATICQTCRSRSFINSRFVPARALKRITIGWAAGAISALMTLVVSLLPLLGISIAGFELSDMVLNIVGALLAGALAFGIYRKSRICAIVLFGYFLYWKVVFVLRDGFILSGLWTGVIFLYCYIQGIVGTFDWHSSAKKQPNNAPEPSASLPL